MKLKFEQRLRRSLCIFCPRKLVEDGPMSSWRSCPCCHHRYRIDYSWDGKDIRVWEQRPLFNAVVCAHRQRSAK